MKLPVDLAAYTKWLDGLDVGDVVLVAYSLDEKDQYLANICFKTDDGRLVLHARGTQPVAENWVIFYARTGEAQHLGGRIYPADQGLRLILSEGEPEVKGPDLTTVAYLIKGFLEKMPSEKVGSLAENAPEYEVFLRLADFQSDVEGVFQELLTRPDLQWEGVWAYEVVEPVGNAIARYALQHGELPGSQWVRNLTWHQLQSSGSWQPVASDCPAEATTQAAVH